MVDAVNGVDLSKLGLTQPKVEKKQELGQEAFLNLMVTQLKNQDPFKPLDSGEFLGQLAQFGTVQGLSGLQTSFDGLAGSLVSNQALQAASLVGRSALVESDHGAIAAGGSLEGAVDVPAATGGVRVEIRDAAGQVVRHLELGPQTKGLTRFHWDGLNDAGVPAPAGNYQVVAGYQKDNSTAAAVTLVDAPVDSVLFGADGFTVQLRGIGDVPFSAVREIRNDPI
jgi:flagellar basal-body rod modification protein FlgD